MTRLQGLRGEQHPNGHHFKDGRGADWRNRSELTGLELSPWGPSTPGVMGHPAAFDAFWSKMKPKRRFSRASCVQPAVLAERGLRPRCEAHTRTLGAQTGTLRLSLLAQDVPLRKGLSEHTPRHRQVSAAELLTTATRAQRQGHKQGGLGSTPPIAALTGSGGLGAGAEESLRHSLA